jgi:DNA topoisomerase IA
MNYCASGIIYFHKIDSHQMMELLLKEIRAGQEKEDALLEEIRTNQVKLLAKMKDDQEEQKAHQANMMA